MADAYTNTTAVYMLPGMRANFYIPSNSISNNGFFKATGSYTNSAGTEYNLDNYNGFYVENDDVGEIVETSTERLEVTYEHHKAEKNSVVFVAADKETIFRFDIIAVPIHDHSSIVQGGPAYGTYFTDGEED